MVDPGRATCFRWPLTVAGPDRRIGDDAHHIRGLEPRSRACNHGYNMIADAAHSPRAERSIPRPVMDRAGKSVVVLLILLGVGALGGGAALVYKPDGSFMQMPLTMLSGSPFPDFFVPGLILGGLFGLGSLAVAAFGLRRWHVAPFLAFAIGCGQMIWIVVELAIIKGISILHPICFGIGLAIAAASVPWGWATFQGWRAVRG
jgi:hypothetical protein